MDFPPAIEETQINIKTWSELETWYLTNCILRNPQGIKYLVSSCTQQKYKNIFSLKGVGIGFILLKYSVIKVINRIRKT